MPDPKIPPAPKVPPDPKVPPKKKVIQVPRQIGGIKLKAVKVQPQDRDPTKRYFRAGDTRGHSERFAITAERLQTIIERMKNAP